MTIHLGQVPLGSVLPIPFATYGKTDGESITLSGLAVTDIEVYKNGSVTQRASDNGYTLLDTDGIDFDGLTGIHGFSIDTGDNSDTGFYSAGAWYWVVVSSVTIDGETVNFVAATFRIGPAESVAGVQKVDVSHIEGSDATNQIRDSVVDDATRIDGSALNTLSSHDPGETIMGATDTVVLTDDSLTAAKIAANAIDASALASDAVTEIQSGLATASALSTLDGKVDTIDSNVDAILEDTGTTLPATLATIAGYIDTEVTAIINAIADLPTNAELATALGTADDATLAQIALVKAKTDLIPGTQDGKTFAEMMVLISAVLLGKASGLDTDTAVFRAINDSKDRVTATVDEFGNRSAVTLDAA